MSAEELNKKSIKFEIQGICQDCIHLDKIVPIIREMLSEEYKTGLEQELQKYKSLYQNEKDHTDTLKKIIKEVKENLEKHLNAKSYGNHKYELFDRKYLEDLLDLLKEIK